MGRSPAFFHALAETAGPVEALRQMEAEIAAREDAARQWKRQGAALIAGAMQATADELRREAHALVGAWA